MSTDVSQLGQILGTRREVPATAAPPVAAAVNPQRYALTALAALGTALGLIGWVDVLLNFYPLQIGNPDWEFGTTSVAIDSLPLGTIGVGLIVTQAVLGRGTWTLRLLALACFAVVAGLVGMLGLYALALPAVWQAAGPMQGPLSLAVAKTGTLALVYLSLYGVLGSVAWRCARSLPKPR